MTILSQTRLLAARVGRQNLSFHQSITRVRLAHTKTGTTGETSSASKTLHSPRNWRTFSAKSAALCFVAYLWGQRTPLALEPEQVPLANLPLDASPKSAKPRLVILGSGWGATSLLKNINTDDYEVVLISPTNYFLFTPLLPSATVGTVEIRSLMEPIRRLLKRINGRYIECEATDIDFDRSVVKLQDADGNTADLPYDKLVVAVGSTTNSMGVQGVEHCHQLKTFRDAANIRNKIVANFERASLPTTSPEERERLLSFVICGGGVEFAAELYEFLTEDLVNYFPEIPVKDVRVSIIQSQDHILNTYDRIISEYAELIIIVSSNILMIETLEIYNIDVLARTRVTRVEPDHIVNDGKLQDDELVLPFGLCLWSTGIGISPLVKRVKEHLGDAQKKARALSTDNQLRVRGVPAENVYAIGDCASMENPRLLDHIVEFFADADTNHDGVLDRREFQQLGEQLKRKYPHTTEHLNKLSELFDKFDVDKSESIDRQMTALPATAQVASQQGKYMAQKLNKLSSYAKYASTVGYPFGLTCLYRQCSSGDFGPGRVFTGGWIGKYLWRGAYWNEQVSLRTRVLLAVDWTKELLFGRDISQA
ncbi:pyridine nucleotide-disulfide oxidoreductase-domain-containing protein [Syncephalis plumigaleata]|nr:pyridine nucleotide-disulfide oxidoreductase-domain-containing protein [Syncephalis plumigaleata]